MAKRFEKRWDRHYGYATAYWVDRGIDEFEEGYNNVIRLGCKFYERFNYQRFFILREIESFDETIYNINEV